ncbi:MAG: polyphosphate kinase [Cyclobacteriaceae bacterium]|nr:polyphosphate kinase [Cyclobacteriaceae bacterium]
MIKLKALSTLPDDTFSKKDCNDELKVLHKKLFELQNVFYADSRFALLIIFQGLDTSGKDGTIRHVMSCMNPMGVQVKAFKEPTTEERTHDFLWRIFPHFPAKGIIEVFNRSYYEDILVPSIEESLSQERIHHRCTLISRLEEHFESDKTLVLKFFLHVSQAEQEKRIQERLTQPHKRWKYSKEDETVAERWNKYVKVYDMIVNECSSPAWNIIPSDKRWYRNFAVAKILTEHLEALHLHYPASVKSK